MDVEIGSNLFRNSDGVVEVEGLPQIEFVLRNSGGPLMVNFVVFDENGKLLAKVVNSTMAFNESSIHALERTPTSIKLTKESSGKVVLQAYLREPDRVVVPQAEFVTIRGHLLEVSSVEWRIGEKRASQGDEDVKGGPVVIG